MSRWHLCRSMTMESRWVGWGGNPKAERGNWQPQQGLSCLSAQARQTLEPKGESVSSGKMVCIKTVKHVRSDAKHVNPKRNLRRVEQALAQTSAKAGISTLTLQPGSASRRTCPTPLSCRTRATEPPSPSSGPDRGGSH